MTLKMIMRRLALIQCILLCLASAARGQDGWRTRSGTHSPDTESRKSVHGFGGWLIATSDTNWRQKWETPPTASPSFTEAKIVRRGQRIAILAFYANPLRDHGAVDVTSDLDVLRPNGTAEHQRDILCYRGPLHEPAWHTFLCPTVIDFVGESTDPSGRWIFRVVLRDNVRHESVPVTTSFVLK